MARKGETMAPEELTAARVQELLAAPDRARRAAEAQQQAEARAPAHAALRAGLEARLGAIDAVYAEVTTWFERRPRMDPVTQERALGDTTIALIDRALKAGRDLLNMVGESAQATGRSWLAQLTAGPLDSESFHAALACLTDLETREGIVTHRVKTWRAVRVNTVAQLTQGMKDTRSQIEWLGGNDA